MSQSTQVTANYSKNYKKSISNCPGPEKHSLKSLLKKDSDAASVPFKQGPTWCEC